MAVVALPNISPQGGGGTALVEWKQGSITGAFRSPLGASIKTLERPGAWWEPTLRFGSLFEDKRARLQAFLASCRGQAQRFYVPAYDYVQRGSFPSTELLSNNFFASGTTGWSSTNAVLTAVDGMMRITATSPSANVQLLQSATLTQYAPYALRALILDGYQTAGLTIGPFLGAGNNDINAYATTRGLLTAVAVTDNASAENQFPVVIGSTSGFHAGAYVECHYASLARCALVDNGPNLFQRSDSFDNAYWTKTKVSISADADQDPVGTTTSDRLVEDNTSGQHLVSHSLTVASAAQDIYVSVAAKSQGRDFIVVGISEATGGTFAEVFFNLSTGAIGSGATGANWSNRRSFIRDLGGGWYHCCLVVRKTNAAPTVTPYFMLGSADGTSSYAGDGSSAVRLWRATAALSSVPNRLVQTTAAESSGTSQTGGFLYLKGLPASTSGLLLTNDLVEIVTTVGSELKRVMAPLNSDAAGLGYLQFEPPLRNSPADNAAVIICRPMMRALLNQNSVSWTEHSGGFSDLEFTAIEDTAA